MLPLVGYGQEPGPELLPPPDAVAPPAFQAGSTGDLPMLTRLSPEGELLEGQDAVDDGLNFPSNALWPFGYDLRQSNTSWLVGGGDDFGMFSLEGFPSLEQGKTSGIVGGASFHFLGGPIQTDMPPRLFDFQIGYQQRKWLTPTFGYDAAAKIGVFSDFEGSAREGVRYPAHAVGYFRATPTLDLVVGLDFLDRDDFHMLPVAGVIVSPLENLRLELVYPRPRAELRISPLHSLYLMGELGGGTWAIERASGEDDVATYRDLRLLFGISTTGKRGGQSAFEMGYVFARDLGYRSGDHFEPQETLLLRLAQLY